jgi:branched-chain amino acid transport system ATP-binding protein
MTMPEVLLEAQGLVGGYGKHCVLRDVDISLQSGAICGVIGPNGAGKTTLLRMLYGIVRPTSGFIRFDGRDISQMSVRERLMVGMGYVPQERNVFPGLSVADNIDLALSVHTAKGDGRKLQDRRDFVFDLFPRLAERKNQAVGLMSGGEQRMVAISLGLIARPRVLLLDEPTTGLAPIVVHQLMDTIRKINSLEGIATIVVEQNVLSLLGIIDSLYVVKDGRASLHRGKPTELENQKIWEYM